MKLFETFVRKYTGVLVYDDTRIFMLLLLEKFPPLLENHSTDLMDLSERRIGLIFHNNE